MPKLGRRQSIKLGAAALVVGPSVVFSREASAAASKRPLLRAGAFKVEIEGVYDRVPGVVSVDLGSASASTDYGKWVHDYLKMSLAKDASKLSKGFEAAMADGSVHKVSVSLYSKASKSPAVTYHVLDALPVSIDHKGEAQVLEWKVGSIETEALAQSEGALQLTKKAFKAEIDGQVIAVQSLHKFSVGKKNAVVSTVFNPQPGASKAWLAPRAVKVDGASDKIVVSKKGGSDAGDTVPMDSFSLDFGKITLDAAKVHDQVVLTTALNVGTQPASTLLRPNKLGSAGVGANGANKASPKLMNVASATTAAANKSTPVLILHSSTGKHDSHVMLKYAAPPLADKSSGASGIKLSLRAIEFPKLQVGSKALVTETLRFEVDDG